MNNKSLYSHNLFSRIQPFAAGGCSGILAICLIQPLDVIKTRIQLLRGTSQVCNISTFNLARNIIVKEGIQYLYSGLGPGIWRQATYGTIRIGIFRTLSNYFRNNETGRISPSRSIFSSMTAGSIAAFISNPVDFTMVRIQADSRLSPNNRIYSECGAFQIISRIYREEGAMSFFQGWKPCVIKAMTLNIGMLATYDQTRQYLKHTRGWKKNGKINFTATALSGIFAAAFSLPFDFLKVRMQTVERGNTKGMIATAYSILKQEGPMTFYRGFSNYYIRIGGHAMLTLTFLQIINSYFEKRKKFIEK